ncbi:MAG TPA: hypothetical protein VMH05_20160 [Bryobacteraceae bacterium]|nr:hypothetical protein [Bryobacteraceae bacterium]
MLQEASYYARMAAGIARYLRAPSEPNPLEAIRARVERRETTFLETVRRAIFSKPNHPYREMFRLAGCDQGDLADSVRRHGLESTLLQLRRDGVWLDHDEFKGSKPIVRSGKEIPSTARSFWNPLAKGLLIASSGGSRSKGTRSPRSAGEFVIRESHHALRCREFDLAGRAQAEIKAILPSTTGLNPCLRAVRAGTPVQRWFVPGGSWRSSPHYRLSTYALVLWAKTLGASVPMPRQLPWNDFSPVAEWIARRRAAGVACVVGATASAGARIARAAVEHGFDIRGTQFLLNGEPLSDAKGAVLKAAGCDATSHYGISEIGGIGSGCRQMVNRSCVHLFRDSVAAINYRRRAPFADVDVDAILFTTLLASAPHLFINVDMQDCGVIQPAACDCSYSQAGLTVQVSDIHSYGKLTGLGITLLGTHLAGLIEDVLPRRLGGGPGDCQLVQSELGADTTLSLRLSPRLKLDSLERARECFLDELRQVYGGSLAARTWTHANAIEVLVAEPLNTLSGKVLPLHLVRENARSAHAS